MINRFSISATLRTDKPKKNGRCPVNLWVRVNGKRFRDNLNGLDADPKGWNDKKQLPSKQSTDFKRVQVAIDQRRNHLTEYLAICDARGKAPTLEEVKLAITGQKKSILLVEGFQEYMSEMGYQWAERTLASYTSTLNHLKNFRPNTSIFDVDLTFLESFRKYLTKEVGNSEAGTFNKFKHLKAFFGFLAKKGEVDKSPFLNFKMPKVRDRLVYLTIEEIKKLENHDFDKEFKHLGAVRDLFVFCCYTGMSFGDMQNLSAKCQNVEVQKSGAMILKYKRVKVKNATATPFLLPEAYSILKKYSDEYEDKAFPTYSEPYYNRKLKEIAKITGISKHITSHVARHTFATWIINQGIGDIVLAQMMGHASTEMTKKYAKVNFTGVENALYKVA